MRGAPLQHVDLWAVYARYVQAKAARHGKHLHDTHTRQRFLNNAHAGSRTRVTSMGGLYDTATLHALVSQNHSSWSTISLEKI